MTWRVVIVVTALIVAGCTGADESSRSTVTPTVGADEGTATGTGGFELVAPDPDPTPIEPTDDVRIGTLDNGLTYYVQSNDSPGQSLSLRLAINAGSLQQEDPESGLAHFLEHMLFNGTEQFPGNEMTQVLQGIGVLIGPDLNAYTSFDETVYGLDLTDIDDASIDTAFSVLTEWASAATLEPQAAVDERGVVREEIRLRDEGADGVITAVFDEAYLRGTAYEGHEPGGRSDLILETDADQLRRFYQRWYRPDLMAVVAVGDLSADRLEQEVRDRFSDLESQGSDAPQRVEPEIELSGEPIVDVVAHPEVPAPYGSIDYPIASWDVGTVGGERLTLIQDLYALMIHNRLLDAVDQGESPFDEPWVGRFAYNRHQNFLGFNLQGSEVGAGIDYTLAELRRIELAGFTNEELARAVQQISAQLDQFQASSASTNDAIFAEQYVANYLSGAEISSVDDTHQRLTSVLEEVTAAEVTGLFRWDLSQTAPIVVAVGSEAGALPTEAELAATIAAAENTVDDSPGDGEVEAIEQLMSRPESVEPTDKRALRELEGTEWVFANGVTVRHISSDIVSNAVHVQGAADGGWSALSPDDASLAPVAVDAVSRSGVAEYDRLTYRRFLAESSTELLPYIDETSEGFFGSAATEDLEILFQRLHLLVTEPRVEDTALRQAIDDAEDRQRLVETDTASATNDALADMLYAGDPRFAVAPDGASALTGASALDLYRQRFGAVDDLTIAVVGDVGTREVEELAAAYLGTLPAREGDSWVDVRPEPISGVVSRELVVGSGEATGAVSLLYPSGGDVTAKTLIELQVLEQILDSRLFDGLREELGATYGGYVVAQPRFAPTEGVEVLFFANVDPNRVEETRLAMVSDAEDLATRGPTSQELELARSVIEGDFALTNNQELIDLLLTGPEVEPLTFERRSRLLDQVTVGAVQSLAQRVLPDGVRAEVTAFPG